MIIEYPAKSYERCTKNQLLTVAYGLESMRDHAIERAKKAEASIERVRYRLGELLTAIHDDSHHNGHSDNEGEPGRPGCVYEDISAALDSIAGPS